MWNKMDIFFSSRTIRLLTVSLFCSIAFASDVDLADNSELSITSDKNDSIVSPSGLRSAANVSLESVNSTDDGLTNPFIPFIPGRETDEVASTSQSGGTTNKITMTTTTMTTTTTTTKPPTTEAATTTTTTATTTSTPKQDATTFDTESDTTTVTNAPSTTFNQLNTNKPTSMSKISHVTSTVLELTTPRSTIRTTSSKSIILPTKTPQEHLTTSTDAKIPDSMTTQSSTFKQTTEVPTTIKKSVSMATSIITESTSKPMTQKTDKQTVSPTEFKEPITERLYDNSTIERVNSTTEDPLRIIVIYSEDDFMSRDSFWPIALALTIGIPCIIVMAVTITVLYRRRTANPRSRLSMYAGHDYSTM